GTFTVASALCGLAPTVGALIAARVLQGVGGGMLTPVSTAMLFRAFPPSERAKASGALMIPTTLAPALGPIFGGLLVDQLSWHWIFFINLPIGLAGFVYALLNLREHREPRAGGFDLWGFVLSGGSMALILFALGAGPQQGWTAPAVLASAFGGAVLLAALVAVELRSREPMLDLRILRDRMFRNGNLAAF